MAKGFKAGAGGGASLNFKVVGNPQPENPRENTVWLNTDVPIGAWYFSATQPDNLVSGDVWIAIGASGSVEFNAIKKNGIQINPVAAKQYINGALVYKDAKVWQNNAWRSLWDGWLYNAGNQYEDITGGWQTSVNGGTATIGASSMSVSAGASGKSASITTANIIDLSQFDTLNVNVTSWSSGDNSANRCQIRILDANNQQLSSTPVAKKGMYAVDVSTLTEGYIQIRAVSAEAYTHKMTVDQIWLSGESSILLADLDAAYQEGVNSAYD